MRFPWSKKQGPTSAPTPPPIARDRPVPIEAFIAELHKLLTGSDFNSEAVLAQLAESNKELYEQVAGAKGEERGRIAIELLKRARAIENKLSGSYVRDYWELSHLRDALMQLAGRLIASKGAVSVAAFPQLVDAWTLSSKYSVSYARVASAAEHLVADHGPAPKIVDALRPVLKKLEAGGEYGPTAEQRRQAARFRQILYASGSRKLDLPEPWQAPFADSIWSSLLIHAATAKTTQMSAKWAAAARPLLETGGTDRYLNALALAVEAIANMPREVDPLHADMLRGLAWTAGLCGNERAAGLLGKLVIASGHKLQYIGARSQKGFSGAVGALEGMGSFEALAQLSNARNRIKTPSLSAALIAALRRAAEKQQLPLEDLEELVVPTYGLDVPGIRVEQLGSVEARLEVSGACDVQLRWFRGGKELHAPPAEVKTEHVETLKELQSVAKEMKATLSAQRARVEGMMLSGRTLPYPAWRERYFEHPLLASMARRLVWRFANPDGEQLGMAPEGTPIDLEGRPLEELGERTMVRLWHPINAGASAIEAWREFLVSREIRQPFKQAYREIYILTAAEERTNTYSNRFAAHILKQHQFSALARTRGWRYTLQGDFDGGNAPSLDLPQWGLRAEFFVQVADIANQPDALVMTESGIALYLGTDQVRFVDLLSGSLMPLAHLPPVVFSEVMRDVDLFVGVSSVGNDPSWSEQGEQFGMGTYWRQVSFGDLSATAETRKAVLHRLLPRLTIADVAKLDGKFLVVRGKRRTYKIHLGSGNILMEPNDQYLCIVPGSVKGSLSERLYLPFEGDGVLAIILSKAFMLAKDDKITDPTITRQL
ncbi:MAG TPA: DUF4132 domain-containing protein [Fimbriimonadaceae bacterium]|nr:DUF4132 domain-containing protein [Fimbriimonadaceae bacterium]